MSQGAGVRFGKDEGLLPSRGDQDKEQLQINWDEAKIN